MYIVKAEVENKAARSENGRMEIQTTNKGEKKGLEKYLNIQLCNHYAGSSLLFQQTAGKDLLNVFLNRRTPY